MAGAPIITVDGPSGSGKGTISRRLARQLGWRWLDSGALYRLVAYAGRQRGLAISDAAGHAYLALHLDVRFDEGSDGVERIWLDGVEVSVAIRGEDIGKGASVVAAMPEVRAALLERQRAFAGAPGLVADGRDMGSVVFPAAELKIYLTASARERALRRHKQLKQKGLSANLAALSLEIAERDRRDMDRPIAPLKPADDAVVVDSTSMTIDAVVERVLQLAAARRLF
ncbi:cytidylate kinase [Steroidobacter denitrificans]|uniref:Cytidylate kinase n=1 Tax=Steroidobacter denitrificans TaxID=465721 RepID=A0A127FBE0_STEDE|nr:(d)CMP kinase [Steroidobacter denitrificans]AMN46869.1 cytidylate kinase [Steroidobacter denitrificans]